MKKLLFMVTLLGFSFAIQAATADNRLAIVFRCHKCGTYCDDRGSLIIHKKKHNEKSGYSCQNCQRQFLLLENYKKHRRVCLRSTGPRQKNFDENTCLKCLNHFKTPVLLKEHQKKRIKCDFCTEIFCSMPELQIHRKHNHKQDIYSRIEPEIIEKALEASVSSTIEELIHEVYDELRFDSSEGLACAICRSQDYSEKRILHDDHAFCHDCLSQSLAIKRECPLCRKPISADEAIKALGTISID